MNLPSVFTIGSDLTPFFFIRTPLGPDNLGSLVVLPREAKRLPKGFLPPVKK